MSALITGQPPTRRPGYVAQVGLDFGTAYSKCIVRDVGTGLARVVESGTAGQPYLFPSIVYWRDGKFMTECQPGSLELPFAKVLLASLARERGFDSRTTAWEGPLGREQMKNLENAAARLLARILREAQNLVGQMMPGFGSQEDDLFYVNMCVPVDDLQDQRTQAVFKNVLESAWILATSPQRRGSPAEMCFLYPEVAANVQAFLKSGFAHNEWGNPLFMTDVGAGTVDQSYFIPTQNLESLTFLSGLVESLGSSQIEKRCADLLVPEGGSEHFAAMQKFRAFKESRGDLEREAQLIFNQVVDALQKAMAIITQHTVSEGRSKLTEVGQQRQNQFGRTKVLFAGGGIRDLSYRGGVFESFRQTWALTPDYIELPRPNDLLRAFGAAVPEEWFRRLTVAYGLSFIPGDLQSITLPNQLQPLPARTVEVRHGNGLCAACGRPTVYGDDYCYTHQ